MKIDLIMASLEWDKVALTVIITGLIACAILKAMEPKKNKAATETTNPKPSRPGELQTGLGVLLVCLSVVAGFYVFMFYDVTVQTRAGAVVNLAKNSERMILLGACGVGVIVGTLMGVVGTMRQGAGMGRQSDSQRGGTMMIKPNIQAQKRRSEDDCSSIGAL